MRHYSDTRDLMLHLFMPYNSLSFFVVQLTIKSPNFNGLAESIFIVDRRTQNIAWGLETTKLFWGFQIVNLI